MNLTTFIEWSQKHTCGLCKKKFDKSWIVGKYPNFRPNVDIMVHWEQTHGFPHEIYLDEWKSMMSHADDPLLDYAESKGAKTFGEVINVLHSSKMIAGNK